MIMSVFGYYFSTDDVIPDRSYSHSLVRYHVYQSIK